MFSDLLRRQHGVVTSAQASAAGLSVASIRAHLTSGRWQRLHHGVYATFSGDPPRMSQLCAAQLAAGPGAVLSHESAAELVGLVDKPARRIHVTVPADRRISRLAGVVIHYSEHLDRAKHPAREPGQTRIEETVIDLTQTVTTVADALGWLARAVNSSLTTETRLRAAIAIRPRVRWRRLLTEALGEVREGCRSLLEIRYFRDVEKAHGLPRGERQARRAASRRFDDVRYREFHTRVELDGRAAHPEDRRFRDMDRDNEAVDEGDYPLRYGTPDIVERPCRVAAQVGRSLRRGGWTGRLRRCSRPGCPVGT